MAYIGNKSPGGTGTYSISANTVAAYKFTSSGAFTATKMASKMDGTFTAAGEKFRLGIYSDDTGPDALLGYTEELEGTGEDGWIVGNLTSSVSISASTDYWLAIITDSDIAFEDVASTGGSGFISISDTYSDGFADPCGTGGNPIVYSNGIYATDEDTAILGISPITAQTNSDSFNLGIGNPFYNQESAIVVVTVYDTSSTDGLITALDITESYNGTAHALTKVDEYYDGTCDGHVSIWYTNDTKYYTPGTQYLRATFGGTCTDIMAAVMFLDTEIEVDATATEATGNGSPSITWSTVDPDTICVAASISDQSVTTNITCNDTSIYSEDLGSDSGLAAYAIRDSTGSQTIDWTDTDNDEDWVAVGASFTKKKNVNSSVPAYLTGPATVTSSQSAFLGGITTPSTERIEVTFEGGDLSEFDSTTGTITVGTSSKMAGKYGASITMASSSHSDAYGIINIPSSMDSGFIWISMFVNLTDMATTLTDMQEIVRIRDSSGNTLAGIEIGDTGWHSMDGNAKDDEQGEPFSLQAWLNLKENDRNHIGILIYKESSDGAHDGYMDAYVNGEAYTYVTSNINNTTSFASMDNILIGLTSGLNSLSASCTFYIDDIYISAVDTRWLPYDYDSIPAYLKGGTGVSDNQPAYLEGSSAGGTPTSDNQAAYLKGQDTASDNQPAYLIGSINTSDNQIAYLAGQDTASSNQSAYLVGFDAQTSSITAYLKGQDTATSSKSAYLQGGINVTDNQIAYTKGQVEVSSNQGAYLTGPDDLPFFDGFESGDASAWTGSSGTPSYNGTAAQRGSYGMEVDATSAEYVYYQWSNSTDQNFRVGFWINYNNVSGGGGDTAVVVDLLDGVQRAGSLSLSYNSSDGWVLRVLMRNDSGLWDSSSNNPISSGWHWVEAEWTFADTSGHVEIYIDGEEKLGVTTSDTGTRFPDEVRFGDVIASPAIDSGTYYVDHFTINNTGDPIGMADSSISAYLFAGVATQDNQSAYLSGSVDIADNQSAYSHGQDTATDNQSAYLVGEIDVTDNQPAYLIGSIDTESSISAFLAGGINVTDSQESYLVGSQDDTSSQPAYLVGQDTATSNIPAFIQGQDTALDNQIAYTSGGVETSDNQPAYMEGGATLTSSSVAAYLKGQDTATASQEAYLVGSINTSDNQIAYLIGSQDATDNQPAYTVGQDTAIDNQIAYLVGSEDATDNQPAYLLGSIDVTDNQPTYLIGSQDDSSSILAYLEGVDTQTDNQPAYLVGQDTATTNQPAYIHGVDSASDSIPVFTLGGINVNSNILVYTSGQDTATSNQSAYLSGSIDLTDNQPAYMQASDTASSSISSFLQGSIDTSDSILAFLQGSIDVDTSIEAYTKGSASLADNQEAYTKGGIAASDSISAYMLAIGEWLVPDGDITVNTWKREDESTSNLYLSINEADPDDDDYVYHADVSGTEYFEVSLSDPTGGTVGDGDVTIWWRGKLQGGSSVTMRVQLREGVSTVIAQSDESFSNGYVTYTYTLSSGEKASVTDWTNLRLRFIVQAVT